MRNRLKVRIDLHEAHYGCLVLLLLLRFLLRPGNGFVMRQAVCRTATEIDRRVSYC